MNVYCPKAKRLKSYWYRQSHIGQLGKEVKDLIPSQLFLVIAVHAFSGMGSGNEI
jgi:hypothetical protein